MIFLIGPDSDATLNYFYNYIISGGQSALRLTLTDIYKIFLNQSPICEPTDFLHATGFYIREPAEIDMHSFSILSAIYSVLDGKKIIYPSRNSTNWSKPLHYKTLKKLTKYTRLIEWKCTNIPSKQNNKVVKPASSLRGEARFGNKYSYDNLEDTAVPFIIQPEISGMEIRVHVIDDLCIPLKISADSDSLDYKVSGIGSTSLVKLPLEIENECVSLSKSEGLIFSGVDLIFDGNDYFVFEVNPMPGYHSFELKMVEETQPISEKILNYLLK